MNYTVFLSYRRDDAPGYVARLGDDLVDAFGDVVFRDVDAILAGDEWETVLKRQVAQANVVLALIGPHWAAELEKRRGGGTDYVRLELNSARELGVPVVPVLVGDTKLPGADDLGDLDWLRDLQGYSLLDAQNRWKHDSAQLIDRVASITGLERRMKKTWWKDPKWIVGAIAVPVLVMIITILATSNGDKTIVVKNGVGGENVKTGDITINGQQQETDQGESEK